MKLTTELEMAMAAVGAAHAAAQEAAASARVAPVAPAHDAEKAEIIAENRSLIADVVRLKAEMNGVLVRFC